MKKTRIVAKRRATEKATVRLQPIEVAAIIEGTGPARAIGDLDAANAETTEMVALDGQTVEMVALEDVEFARGSAQVPPPVVYARGPRRTRTRMQKIDRR